MKTYTQIHGDDAVVVPVVMAKETYQKLEKLVAICAKRQGDEVEDNDIPDLCEQAIIYALNFIDEDYGLEDPNGQDVCDS